MENNANEVVEIDLKDLMFAVLHKWRPVLAVAVIMAVLRCKGHDDLQEAE